MSRQWCELSRTYIRRPRAAAALQMVAAQQRVHIDARAMAFLDLLVPVCSRPVLRVWAAFSMGARLRECQAEPGAAKSGHSLPGPLEVFFALELVLVLDG